MVVCKTRRSYSKFPAIVVYYQAVVQEVAARRPEAVRSVGLVAVLLRQAHWHSEEAEEECWS